MPFNIEDHPFYNAVMQFENINRNDPKKVQEVFNTFLALSKEYNVYAAHYLNYLIENREGLRLVVPTEDDFLKDFQEYFAQLPTIGEPQKWCEASQLIVLYRNANESAPQREDSKRKLKKMVNVPNAIVFLEENSLLKKQDKKNVWNNLSSQRGLYILYYLKKYAPEKIEMSPHLKNEWAIIEETIGKTTIKGTRRVICLEKGKLEQLLSDKYNVRKKTSNREISASEMMNLWRSWMINSALMGDMSSCFTLLFYSDLCSEKIPSNSFGIEKISKEEHEKVIFLAACHGHFNAQVIVGNVHFRKGEYGKALPFYKKCVEEEYKKKLNL